MTKRILIAAVLALMFSVPFTAKGEERKLLGTLTKKTNSVAKVMRNAGCDIGWLSQVLADSRIDPARLRHLPVGERVYLEGGRCSKKPEPRVARLSLMLLRADKNIAEAGEAVATAREAREEAERQKASLEKKVGALERSLGEAAKKKPAESAPAALPAPTRSEYLRSPLFTLTFLGGALLGLLPSLFLFVRRERKNLSLPKVWEIKEEGETFRFALVGAGETSQGSGVIVGRYQCPACPERNIFGRGRNLRAHIRNCCTRERVVVDIDPSFAEKKRAAFK